MQDFEITFANNRFFASGNLPVQRLKAAGWYVYPDGFKARTARIEAVRPFAEFCQGNAATLMETEATSAQVKVADSFAADANIYVPAPPGMEYRGYQLAGIKYMSERWGVLNADVPRLGKTIQTLGVANLYRRTLRILVICPAIAKIGWQREANAWLVAPHTIGIAYGDDLPNTDVVIINYELLQRHRPELYARSWDIVVVDEAHYLGSGKSNRTKVSFGLRPSLHFIALTGTPAFTRPRQLWPLLRHLDPGGLGKNWITYTRRYCAAYTDHWGRYNTNGYSNLADLQMKLRTKFMVRREKSDVLEELPPMRKTVYLPADGLKKLLKTERRAFQNHLDDLLDMIREGDPDVDSEAFKIISGDDGDSPAAEAKRELALRKVPMVVDYVKELLETEDKVVVFYHHRDPLRAFYESFPGEKIARIWGGMTAKQREDERVRFQGDSACRIMVANLQAASTAIELSSADTVVFAEFSRAVPSEFDQGEERVWLPTKDVPVAIHNLVVEGSLEADIAEALEYRRGQLERLTCRAHLK